jgi:hypothetical protein
LSNYDVEPEAAEASLLERYGANGPSIYDIHGIWRVYGHFLSDAGYDTPEVIATASLDDLTAVSYLGEQTVPKVHDRAQEYIGRKDGSE